MFVLTGKKQTLLARVWSAVSQGVLVRDFAFKNTGSLNVTTLWHLAVWSWLK